MKNRYTNSSLSDQSLKGIITHGGIIAAQLEHKQHVHKQSTTTPLAPNNLNTRHTLGWPQQSEHATEQLEQHREHVHTRYTDRLRLRSIDTNQPKHALVNPNDTVESKSSQFTRLNAIAQPSIIAVALVLIELIVHSHQLLKHTGTTTTTTTPTASTNSTKCPKRDCGRRTGRIDDKR